MDAAELMQMLAYILTAIGGLAFLVSMVVQVIKELPKLKNIPTNAVAFVVSLILCPIAVVIACQYFRISVTWYYIFASFMGAFVVYLVSTGG